MKQVVLCGCSLGESWMPYFDGKVPNPKNEQDEDKKPGRFFEELDKDYELGNWDVTRFQMGGSGNGMFLHNLLNYFGDNKIKDTTVIVQFTGIKRRTAVIDSLDEFADTSRSIRWLFHNNIQIINYITNRVQYYINDATCEDGLTGSKLAKNTDWSYNFSNLVSLLCMLSKLGAKVYAFRGWPGALKEIDKEIDFARVDSSSKNNTDYWIKSRDMLNNAGVITTDLDYTGTAISLSKSEDDWLDDSHPNTRLGCEAFDKIWKELNAY